jgi:ribose transport system substrate-binding protein
MSSSRTLWIVVVLVVAVSVLWYRTQVFSTPSAGPKANIVVVTGGSSPFWQLIGNGAKSAAADLDVRLELLMPEEDENIDLQVKLLSGINVNMVDGVAVSPLDAEGQSALINRFAEKAFIVTMDSDAPQSARHSYVGTSNIAAARTCARLVHEALPDGGKVAVLLANLTKQNMIERKQGFEENIAVAGGPTYEVVGYLIDQGDPKRGEELIRNVLEEHPDLACLVGMNAQHGPRMLQILQEADKLGDIKLIAFDEVEETLAGVEAGHIYATVTQDPYQYGYQSVRTLVELSRSTEAQRPMPGSKSTISISTRVVRQEDVKQFRSYLKSRLQPAG